MKSTLGATRIRKARLDQPSTNKSGTQETGHREIVSARKNSKTSIQNFFLTTNETTAKNEHLPSSQPVVIGIHRGNQAWRLLTDWLKQHSLNVIDVLENGNCLFGALFAAVSGFSGPGKMKYWDGVEKEAQVWKERILAVCQEYVMLEAEGGAMRLPNLRQRLVLYPSEEWLHAAAGRLREPIHIIEVVDKRHVQARRYCYQNKTGIDGISREIGCDFNMTILELNKFMRTARQHRVVPTMLLYRRRRNGGDHFQALKFEDHLYQDFLVQETTRVHPNMCERMDDVHSILNMPPVDASPQWEFDLQEDEERHEAAQQLMSTSQDGTTVED
ncbi:hypothetical protein Plhal710r2_c032g0118081 [Plasmopara halstedii]